jgi:hypothetical protein
MRESKIDARNKFKDGLKKHTEKEGKAEWKKDGYRFLFEKEEYYWKGKQICVTDCEALYLYERLVLERSQNCTTSPYALYQLRAKFGNAFLSEVIPYYKGKAHHTVHDVAWEAEGGLIAQVRKRLKRQGKI